MLSFFRSSKLWLAGAFCVALFVVYSLQAIAQTTLPSVDNQQKIPEGIMPEGIEWNRPMKAGEMTLERLPKEKIAKKADYATRSTLPSGGLQAPKIQSKVGPPLLSSTKSSSASVMLMQGMKNALQKAGQNTDIPKSQFSSEANSDSSGSDQQVVPSLQPTVDLSSVKSSEQQQSGVVYQPGQEPKSFKSSATEKPTEAASPSIPADTETPKATELDETPISLEQASSKPAAPEASEKNTAPSTSIFGSPVEEPEEEPEPVQEPEKKACEPSINSWTKECRDAGYPTNYTGKITGETRVECPKGDAQDVWLSNTCASPVSEEKTPVATEIKDAPKSLAKASASDETVTEEVVTRTEGSCGKSNGLAAEGKPAADLCSYGVATEVSGEGPWRWSCKGHNGGMTVSCAAPMGKKSEAKNAVKSASSTKSAPLAEDGKCGASDGIGTETAPPENLCVKGIASRVNGGGPWTWACSGTNGGQAASCNAPRKTDGECGAANNGSSEKMPQRDLCTAGYASAVTGDGPWNWTCSGLYGGNAATCSASPSVNAVCGSATLTGHKEAPKVNLCSSGDASEISGSGPWNWTCSGNNGGADVKCKAPVIVDGACGTANGSSFEKAPESDLCANGTPSRVTGHGPWDWNCAGFDGGETVSCTAALGKKEVSESSLVCGEAAEAAAFQAPSQNLCINGKASAVSGDGPWNWSCSDDDRHTVSCSTLSAVEGACGTASNVPSVEAPSANLCASGTPDAVTQSHSKTNWTWDCKGSLGASTVSCSAPLAMAPIVSSDVIPHMAKSLDEIKCGPSNGQGFVEAPSSGLCDGGKAGLVRGRGPWTWTCGTKSSEKVSCEAQKIINASCGAANGTILKFAPTKGLCSSGTSTAIDGAGPWMWSCVGSGGGTSVSCSASSEAQTKVDGACGAAANAVMTSAPTENLCDSGRVSPVYGEGPWTWTCSGLNGGIAVTCKTLRVLPKAPSPPGLPINANCGPSNGVAAVEQPNEGLCSSGQVTDVSGNGPWNWNCLGENGGMTVSCTAPLMPPAPIVGVCGSANGITTMVTPRSGLCSAGIASAVNGNGPWTWSCSGTNGGGAVSCVAPIAGKSVRPIPSTTSSPFEDAPTPKASPRGLVTPNLPSGPLPPLETGSMPQAAEPVAPKLQPETWESSKPTVEPKKSWSKEKKAEPSSDSVPNTNARLRLTSDVSSIEFKRGSDVISNYEEERIQKLSILLMLHGNERVTLVAYADNSNMTPRDARRLSLSRALAVRDMLVSKGVPSGRIDVRALGANVPSGDMDRVDVKVN